ncbi:MAG TPA: DUF1573 domain-containing protein [Cyclobacteriaceae bacterium]|jgi:hypothetical protein|nr:DUF1573 domain-containing protein [Cyclobacteriaceae bacterium]
MKRILILIFGVAVAAAAFAQTPVAKPNGPILTWEKSTHDFGDIQQGDKVETTYRFTNTGTEPLLITNVTVTCGCTVPKGWPRDPIVAGGKGEIVVAFNSLGKMGKQNKVVTIVSNAANPEGGQVSFTANVLEKKASQ